MWQFRQSSGELWHDGELVATGYSGLGPGKNAPAEEAIENVGPIPKGKYTIGSPEFVTETGPHGPFVLPLTPDAENDMHNRAGFLIHGDNTAHTASHGCIILPRPIREEIAATHDTDLEVIA